ncbi:imm11 family protein [Phyllobacterium sp. 22552]|uniref:imm11 family protein n=1 Tax=Phyllobacterium sp. 22552 TaxID=3453941 RepID=UPI003F87E9DE
MVWIWLNPVSENEYPYADFDDANSVISSADISVSNRALAPNDPSDIVLKIDWGSKEKVLNLACLPNGIRCPLVDDVIGEYVRKYAGDDVELLPVTVRLREKGEVTLKFSYAHPLFHIRALDLEKSIIDHWLIPDVAVHLFSKLVFKSDCLQGRHFARDTYTNRIVVSNELKNALLLTGDFGLWFIKPEQLEM